MRRYLVLLLAVSVAGLTLRSGSGADSEPIKPVNLLVNTDQDEDDPHLSSTGLQLFYTSTTEGKSAIMISSRANLAQAWSPGKPVVELKGKADYRSVFLTPEGKYPQHLYYATNNDPEKNTRGDNFDIYYLVRQIPQADFTSETSVNAVDTPVDEMHPWLTAEGKLYFSRKDGDGWHLYVSTRTAGGGGLGKPVQVQLPVGFHHPTLTPDGRTMYLQGPLEKDRWGLFRTTLVSGKWSDPEPLEGLNSTEGTTGDRSPSLSRDGSKLYFASDRPGGKGGLDLWVVPTGQLGK